MSRVLNLGYHYVRSEKMPGYCCEPDELRSHINFLQSNGFTILTLSKFIQAFREGTPLPERVATLSFDDGLRDGFNIVLPILQEHGCAATFFVITCTLEGKIPGVIALQMIIKEVGVDVVEHDLLPRILEGTPYKDLLNPQRFDIGELYINEAVEVRRIKAVLNALMPHYLKEEKVSELFVMVFGDSAEEVLCEQMFMNENEVRQLLLAGMDVGSHTVTHPKPSVISLREWRQELVESKEALRDLGIDTPVFGYTFGGSFAVRVYDAVRDSGYLGGCNFCVGVKNMPEVTDPFNVPRIDQAYFWENV